MNSANIEPSRLDVKLGRGRINKDHPANVLLDNIIAGRYELFQKEANKDMVCESVIHSLLDIGARFLRQNQFGQWYEVRDVRSLVATIRLRFEDFSATYMLQQSLLCLQDPPGYDDEARLARRIEEELIIQDEDDDDKDETHRIPVDP